MVARASGICSTAFLVISSVLIEGCGTSSMPPPSSGTSSCKVAPLTISHSTGQPNAAQLIVLDKLKYPKALCNDGTSAAYLLRRGFGVANRRWVISLQGGGFCSSQGVCAVRARSHPSLVSSTPVVNSPSRFTGLDGLQSGDAAANPDFYDANQVNVLYCSSDAWSGNKEANGPFVAADVSTWNFQGHAIVQAVIGDLKERDGLASASEVLFTGLSAGAIGAIVNVNDVAAMMPTGTRFVASSDGAYSNDVYNFSASGVPPDYISTDPAGARTVVAQGRLLWNGTGDRACVTQATTIDDLNACYYASHLLSEKGTVQLPMFVSISEEDTAQLQADKVPQADLVSQQLTSQEQGNVEYFAARMRAGLGQTNGNVSVFAPKALIHTVQSSGQLFNTSFSFPRGTFRTDR